MKSINIPVVAFGAGSQPPEAEPLDYLPIPRAEPLRTPLPPENARPEALAAAAAIIDELASAMRSHVLGGLDYPRLSVKGMPHAVRHTLNDALGQGEVSVIVRGLNGADGWRIQETAFAGVWRVQRTGLDGGLTEDRIEACVMPDVVMRAAREGTTPRLDIARLPEGVMNAPAIVRELQHQVEAYTPGRAPHVINLSLLPLAPADHEGLARVLGEGQIAMLSRGFGNCRITATDIRGVWRVQYFNSMSTLILDTLEVVDVPEAARATADDYDESIERLVELAGWLREG